MCKKFEEVTGRKNEGNVGELRGLLKDAVDRGVPNEIISVPVELLDIDTNYQIEARTDRSLNYLVSHWDENKLQPVQGVPHWEEGKIYLFDGYGRWIASQMIPSPKKDLRVMVVLNAPSDPEEREKYEAEMYAYQNIDVARMTAPQTHGARLIMHDKATETLEKMKQKYGFEYVMNKGNRSASVLGSYTEALSICRQSEDMANYIFDICQRSGFDRKQNGYSTYVMRALKDVYKFYPLTRTENADILVKYLRGISPLYLKSNAVTKYPLLDFKIATSLFLEDILVEKAKRKHVRKAEGKHVFMIQPEPVAVK